MHTAIKTILLLGVILLACNGLGGCSGTTGSPVAPITAPDALGKAAINDSQRILWGMWDIYFDATEYAVVIEPNRNLQVHFDITDMLLPPACDDCLEIKVNSFDPITRILDVDVTLRNPYQIAGRDIRGILYTNDYGHELLNADDWTKLWDIPGGEMLNPFKAFAKEEPNRVFGGESEHTENYLLYIPIPPQFNKITFAVDASWPGNCKEPYEITNFWQEPIYDVTGSSGNIYVDVRDWQDDVNKVTLVAPEITGEDFTQFAHLSGDIWRLQLTNNTGATEGNYKARIIANSANSSDLALYDFIVITISEALVPTVTGIDPDSAEIEDELTGVTVYGSNFQGPGAQVKLKKAGELDIVATNVTVIDPNTISCDISIPPDAGTGLYDVEIVNGSGLSGIGSSLFLVLGQGPFNPVDVTPPWLNFAPEDVCVGGGYLYIAGGVHGLHIFDITDPLNPEWVKKVDMVNAAKCVDVDNGYAYVVTSANECSLQIVDIDPPESAYIAGFSDLPDLGGTVWKYAFAVAVSDGYAYVTISDPDIDSLQVIDVEPINSAQVVHTVDTPGSPLDVSVFEDYAFVADKHPPSLQVINAAVPEAAYIEKTIPTPGGTYGDVCGVVASGGYAYIANGLEGFQVIDLDPLESAHIVKSIEIDFFTSDVCISGSYAYAFYYLMNNGYIAVIDIDSPDDAEIINTVSLSSANFSDITCSIAVLGGYVYYAGQHGGIRVVDVEPPESAYEANRVHTPGAPLGVAISGGYVYVGDYHAGVQIIDPEPLESLNFVQVVNTIGWASDIVISGCYAYLADESGGLLIIDIDPPQSAYIVKSVDITYGASYVDYLNGYAYVTDGHHVYIVDVDPPEEAYIVEEIGWGYDPSDVAVSGGYLYVPSQMTQSFEIYEVNPPEPSIYIKTVVLPDHWSGGVEVANGYAYVGMEGTNNCIIIIDVDPPESAHQVQTVNVGGRTRHLAISGGYAYVPTEQAGLQILDISPPESAEIVCTLESLPYSAKGVTVQNNMVYIAAWRYGLRIVKLW